MDGLVRKFHRLIIEIIFLIYVDPSLPKTCHLEGSNCEDDTSAGKKLSSQKLHEQFLSAVPPMGGRDEQNHRRLQTQASSSLCRKLGRLTSLSQRFRGDLESKKLIFFIRTFFFSVVHPAEYLHTRG
jgi:hypothetical protein